MKIPYGYCENNGTACPSLGPHKGEECSKALYWRCYAFKRAGVVTVKPDEVSHLESDTLEALIREYNTGQY